ncbi:MAG: cytochrome c biogenesis CcdA family protein [Thermoproteota archaeon]|nr:cytochrome c biogenesis protein CcdA [Candidatus Brockarchaeota archaeon]
MQKHFKSFPSLVFTVIFFSIFLTIANASPQNITVYYFVAEGCEHCIRAENHISVIKTHYPSVVFKRFDIFNNDTNVELFITLAEGFNITEENREVPAVFIGDKCLIGEEAIIQKLESLILEYTSGEYYDKAGEIIEHLKKDRTALSLPSLASVVIAAFIDSLNPCAFATIILLLTYSISQGSPKRMLLNCGAFIIGVLVSYFSIGMGLLYLINISPFRILLRYLIGSVAIFFAILEFKEFLFYGKGINLERPDALDRIIKRYSSNITIAAGFLIGMAVSMIELPCTGGIYISMLYVLAKVGLTLQVFLLLLLYNVIFILPLIVIVILVYLGKSLLEIDAWRIEKRRYMRLIAGILLLIVSIAIITGLI